MNINQSNLIYNISRFGHGQIKLRQYLKEWNDNYKSDTNEYFIVNELKWKPSHIIDRFKHVIDPKFMVIKHSDNKPGKFTLEFVTKTYAIEQCGNQCIWIYSDYDKKFTQNFIF